MERHLMSTGRVNGVSVIKARDKANSSWNQTSLLLLKLVRFWTLNSPIQRGKWRLSAMAMRLSKNAPEEMLVPSRDGRLFCVDLSTSTCERLFFHGEYEPEVSQIISLVVEDGDVCIDAGANFGWHTTLLHRLSGPRGAVHAFEPMDKIRDRLIKTIRLLHDASNVYVSKTALGDTHKNVTMYVFPGLCDGHASLSTMGRSEYWTEESEMVTLDSYLEEKSLRHVDFIKIDVEGAEMMLLKGATKLFEQTVPPIFMIEMALATTISFGYVPNDLIVFLRDRADYEFFAVDEDHMALREINGFAADHIGANVLCMPAAHYGDKIARRRKKLDTVIMT